MTTKRPLEEIWEDYASSALLYPEDDDELRDGMRGSFYAGAVAVLTGMMTMDDDDPIIDTETVRAMAADIDKFIANRYGN